MAALAQDLIEQRTGTRYPNGYRHDDYIAAFSRRLDGCVFHTLSREATAMAAQVGLSKPSSILKALAFARAPFPKTWIEFDRRHLRDALGDLGSPLVKPVELDVPQARIGFLVEQREDKLLVSTASEQVAPDGRKVIDAIVLQFEIETGPFEAPDAVARMRAVHPAATGKVRDLLKAIATDPAEAAASDELQARCAGRSPLPEAYRLIYSLQDAMGRERVAKIAQDTTDQAVGAAIQVLIPALILLSCRNAVEVVERPREPKLDVARAKRGKPALFRFRDVVSRFTRPKGAAAGGGSAEVRERRAALVSGHFKTRDSGVYWWSHHARRGKGRPSMTRTVKP